MNARRSLNIAFGLSRIGFGIFATVAPERMGRTWIGADADRGRVKVLLRALGLRDIGLGTGVVAASLRDQAGPVLAASMLSDLGDMTATLLGREELDEKEVMTTVGVTLAAALVAAALLAASECGGCESCRDHESGDELESGEEIEPGRTLV